MYEKILCCLLKILGKFQFHEYKLIDVRPISTQIYSSVVEPSILKMTGMEYRGYKDLVVGAQG